MLSAAVYADEYSEIPAHPKQVNAYDSFMAGKDTHDLAAKYRVTEATALRWVSQERSRRHEIASPYGVR